MDEDFILNYYGIDVSALEEYVFSISEDAAQAESVIIMKVKNTINRYIPIRFPLPFPVKEYCTPQYLYYLIFLYLTAQNRKPMFMTYSFWQWGVTV